MLHFQHCTSAHSATQMPQVVNNPFKNYIDIRFPKLPTGEVRLQLTSPSGTVVKNQRFASVSQSVLRYNVENAASLSKGVYVLTIYNNNEKYSISVIKE